MSPLGLEPFKLCIKIVLFSNYYELLLNSESVLNPPPLSPTTVTLGLKSPGTGPKKKTNNQEFLLLKTGFYHPHSSLKGKVLYPYSQGK